MKAAYPITISMTIILTVIVILNLITNGAEESLNQLDAVVNAYCTCQKIDSVCIERYHHQYNDIIDSLQIQIDNLPIKKVNVLVNLTKQFKVCEGVYQHTDIIQR